MNSFFDRTFASVRNRFKGIVGSSDIDIPRGPEAAGKLNKEDLSDIISACLNTPGGEYAARGRVAALVELYDHLTSEQRSSFLECLATDFGPNQGKVNASIQNATTEESISPVELNKIRSQLFGKRFDLLTLIGSLPKGVKALVDMRVDLLERLNTKDSFSDALKSLDGDFSFLFSSWFDLGFLQLEPINWASPASLLEKLIAYEAVHEIRSWSDLKNRLESDRRCYAFFHPRMPEEPLIFVEVALVKGIAGSVQTLLDENAPTMDAAEADTAVFYSISNTQAGLRGISFGNFLIKMVVEDLKRDLPGISTFVTLSPIPGFMNWLKKTDAPIELPEKTLTLLERLIGPAESNKELLLSLFERKGWQNKKVIVDAVQSPFSRLCASYLAEQKNARGLPLDPVARFHLGNGARLQQINWLGDTSKKGFKQSTGFMVNYLYDLDFIENNHETFAQKGDIPVSSSVRKLLK
jgi:malonyl-CoA decarboxylase